MTGIEVPTRRDIEDLAPRDVTLRHCLDVRIAAKMLTYEDALRIAVVELVRENARLRELVLAEHRAR